MSLFAAPSGVPGRSGARLEAGLEQPRKRRSYVDEYHRPQYSHEESQRKPARGHQSVERKNVDDHRRQHGHRQRHVTVDQQKHRCDDLESEDHPQIVRGIQGTHELTSDASRRRQRNEVQEAIQAENKEDRTRQIAGDYVNGAHDQVLLFGSAAISYGAKHIDVNIVDGVYFGKIQESYGPRYSGDVARLAGHVEGHARVDALRGSGNRRNRTWRVGFPRAGSAAT